VSERHQPSVDKIIMKKKILITGGTGFVGKQIVRELSERGVSLRLIVRKGKENTLSNISKKIEIIETHDVFAESQQWWAERCEGIDTVVHLAWYTEPGKYLLSELNTHCLRGSLSLTLGAIEAGVRRIVGIGTCFEYDLSAGVLSAKTPLWPTSPYAGAKAALYLALNQSLQALSIEFAWCRLFYLYGEGEDSRRFVPYLRSQLKKGKPAELTSGKQIRDFLDVTDAAKMIVNVSLSGQTGAVNICSGKPITVRQLAEQIADEYGRRDLLVFGARPDNFTDPPCVVGI
jgi:dTDP-6-deoxy-L-talose 4-dehydrogenase (NAD+)